MRLLNTTRLREQRAAHVLGDVAEPRLGARRHVEQLLAVRKVVRGADALAGRGAAVAELHLHRLEYTGYSIYQQSAKRL